MRRLLLLAGIAALALLGACSPKKTLVPDVPPQTTLFVQGTLDSVNHLVHLYWYGSDPDGYVVAFEVRFLGGANPADTAWVRTTANDSLFSVNTPQGFAAPTFQVRAIDDAGLIDATPAQANFAFTNQPPAVTIGSYPGGRDTTYASLTFSWTAIDPDGDSGRMRFKVWLDQDSTHFDLVAGTTYTVPTARFEQAGAVVGGNHTVNVQAVDDGGMLSPVASRQWYVRPTTPGGPAKLLIVDDVTPVSALNFRADTLLQNAAARVLPPGSWSTLRLEFTQPFRSDKDVEQTFKLYDAVYWYRGDMTTFPTYMNQLQNGIGAAIDGGARVVLEGLNLVNGRGSNGALTQDFVSKYLDTDFMYKNFQSGDVDSSVSWGVGSNGLFDTGPAYTAAAPARPTERLRIARITSGLRAFAVKDTSEVLLWARYGTLSQTHAADMPVGLSVPHPGGGRAVAITVPIVLTSQSSLQFPQRASVFLNSVLSDLTSAPSSARRHTHL